jgi:hypothetical protein
MANPYSVMYDSLPPPAAATAAAAAATNTEAAAATGVSGSNKRPADTPASSSSGGGLPAGWKKVPSRSRPGAFTYENQYVGPSRPGDVGEWASAVCAVSLPFCNLCGELSVGRVGNIRYAWGTTRMHTLITTAMPHQPCHRYTKERISWVPDRPASRKMKDLPPEPPRAPKPRRPSDPEEAQRESAEKLKLFLEKLQE